MQRLDSDLSEEYEDLLVQWPKSRPALEALVKSPEGIPEQMRGLVWKVFALAEREQCGFVSMETYESYLRRVGESQYVKAIGRDINRTFPNEEFKARLTDEKLTSLFNILKAYSVFDSTLGYCQGMNFVVAMLLLHLEEEDAFWVFVSLMKAYRMEGLFRDDVPMLAAYLLGFGEELEASAPEMWQHLGHEGVSPALYGTEWFTTMFVYNLSTSAATRVYDCVLCGMGKLGLFRTGIAVMKILQEQLLPLTFEVLVHEIKTLARSIPAEELVHAVNKTQLTPQSCRICADNGMWRQLYDFQQKPNRRTSETDSANTSITGSSGELEDAPVGVQIVEDRRDSNGSHNSSLQHRSERIDSVDDDHSFRHPPPLWDPDEATSHCTACNKQFTPIRRKHHCRKCGHIFCRSCSSKRRPMRYGGTRKEVRVCDNCCTNMDHEDFFRRRREKTILDMEGSIRAKIMNLEL